MSVLGQRARELVNGYDVSLEQRIVGGGSSLVCKDEELWKQVEGLLKDGDAQETHCLGLDPLQVMEESLMTTAATGGRAKARGGLQGLAKAFEVLEQAALNLYLGPWREEYKVVKVGQLHAPPKLLSCKELKRWLQQVSFPSFFTQRV